MIEDDLILTSIYVRRSLREVIAFDFPRMRVLWHQELDPAATIQPRARIAVGRSVA